MKEEILDKINRFQKMAKSPVSKTRTVAANTFTANDSLSKIIRNEKEAAIFLNELDAIVTVAVKK